MIYCDADGEKFTLRVPSSDETKVFPSMIDAVKHARAIKMAEGTTLTIYNARGVEVMDLNL